MRRVLLTAAVAVMLLLALPGRARACGQGGAGGGSGYATLAAIMLVGLGTDVGLSLVDAGRFLNSDHPSLGYGVFELVVAAPQLALGISLAKNGAGTWYPIWMGLLSAHGIWTLATAPWKADGPPPRETPPELDMRSTLSIGPAFVPVGPYVRPGIGVTGRF